MDVTPAAQGYQKLVIELVCHHTICCSSHQAILELMQRCIIRSVDDNCRPRIQSRSEFLDESGKQDGGANPAIS